MATYVTDGQGNRYERRYDSSSGTYTDYYAGKATGSEASGNPDAGSSTWRPSGTPAPSSGGGSSGGGGGSSSSGGGGSSGGGYSAPAPNPNQALIDALQADIARVTAARGSQSTQDYYNRYYGNIDDYIASQNARLSALMNQGQAATSPQLPQEYMDAMARIEELQQALSGTQYPEYQPYQPPPYVENRPAEIPWEEYLAQAGEMVYPGVQTAKGRAEELFQQKQEMLPYILAARGQLGGGAATGGAEALTQAQVRAIQEAEYQGMAQAIEIAKALQGSDKAQAEKQLDRDWNRWLAEAEMGWKNWDAFNQHQYSAHLAARDRAAQQIEWMLAQQQMEREDDWNAARMAALQGVTPENLINLWSLFGQGGF